MIFVKVYIFGTEMSYKCAESIFSVSNFIKTTDFFFFFFFFWENLSKKKKKEVKILKLLEFYVKTHVKSHTFVFSLILIFLWIFWHFRRTSVNKLHNFRVDTGLKFSYRPSTLLNSSRSMHIALQCFWVHCRLSLTDWNSCKSKLQCPNG